MNTGGAQQTTSQPVRIKPPEDDTGTLVACFGAVLGPPVVLLVVFLFVRAQSKQRAALAHRQAVFAHQQALQAHQMALHQRHLNLVARFGQHNADRIMRGQFWQGQTQEMLIEALGHPSDVDVRVMKTKTRSVYKYVWNGANRYGLRITLEDGVVVGWEDKR